MNDSLPTPLREFLDQMLAAIPACTRRQQQMREELVLPHRHVLKTFHPLVVAPGWMGRDG